MCPHKLWSKRQLQNSRIRQSLNDRGSLPKEMITVKEGWIPDPNYHKTQRTLALKLCKNY